MEKDTNTNGNEAFRKAVLSGVILLTVAGVAGSVALAVDAKVEVAVHGIQIDALRADHVEALAQILLSQEATNRRLRALEQAVACMNATLVEMRKNTNRKVD